MARKMKDSGIEWIGEIPEDWEVQRISRYCREIKEKNTENKFDNALQFKMGKIVPKKKNFNKNEIKDTYALYTIVFPNSIVINGLNLEFDFITQRVGIVKEIGIITSAYISIIPDTQTIYSDYICYLLKVYDYCKAFHNMGRGLRKVLNYNEFKICLILVPNIFEQQRIADFLDQKCAQIDEILQKTRDTIAEYKKLKQSIITQAVTKGVRGERPMKDSGIEWIGEIPEEWEIRKGKTILTILERPVRPDDRVITCFRDGEVTLRSNRREDGFTFSMQEAGYQGVEQGDLVVHGMDGFAGAIGISDSRGKATPVLNVLNTNQNKRYIMYYLRNMAFVGVFQSLSTGIRIRSCDTNWNKLKILSYLIPLQNEQQEIVAYLDQKCAEIDKLIEKKEQLVNELESYKKSLIYEYVTGKKEVLS